MEVAMAPRFWAKFAKWPLFNMLAFCNGFEYRISAYHAKYLRISWTYLDLLYRFGRSIGGMIISIFVWKSPKKRCYGNQLNLEDVRRHRREQRSHFASAFDNGLTDRKSALRPLNSNNPATSCTKLVNNLTVYAVIMGNFCRNRPQFDDDLHSSRCRSKIDWKIAILIWE